jgi:H+/Cl- antiporter ClcA
MNVAVITMTILSVAIGLVAITLSGLIKLIFFFRQKDSYRHILKFALYGEISGLVISILSWRYCLGEINKWNEPQSIFAIPFFLMLLGLIVGTIVTYLDKRKTSKQTIV